MYARAYGERDARLGLGHTKKLSQYKRGEAACMHVHMGSSHREINDLRSSWSSGELVSAVFLIQGDFVLQNAQTIFAPSPTIVLQALPHLCHRACWASPWKARVSRYLLSAFCRQCFIHLQAKSRDDPSAGQLGLFLQGTKVTGITPVSEKT